MLRGEVSASPTAITTIATRAAIINDFLLSFCHSATKFVTRYISITIIVCRITISVIKLVVKLDLSRVPSTLKNAIMNQTEFVEQIKASEPDQPDVVIIQHDNGTKDDVNSVKRMVKDLLIRLGIRDFVALTDPSDKDKILIMRKKEAEAFDSFHCHHCGMEFMDEVQLGVHQRLHLPF